MVIFVITAFAAITVTLAALGTRELEIREIEEESLHASYMGDAGYERGRYYLKRVEIEPPQFSWWKKIKIQGSDVILSDFPVKITLTGDDSTQKLIADSKLQATCNDIRFYDPIGMAIIPHWIEASPNGCGDDPTNVWVRLSNISASTEKIIYMYYGSSDPDIESGQDQSKVCPGGICDGGNCCELYDDFTDPPDDVNPRNWVKGGIEGSTISVSGSIVTMTLEGSQYPDGAEIRSGKTFPKYLLAKFRVKTTSDLSCNPFNMAANYYPMVGLAAGGNRASFNYQHLLCLGNGTTGHCQCWCGPNNVCNCPVGCPTHNGLRSPWRVGTIIWDENGATFETRDDAGTLFINPTISEDAPIDPMHLYFKIYCDQAAGCGVRSEWIDWALTRKYADPMPQTTDIGGEREALGTIMTPVLIDTDTSCPDSLNCQSTCDCDKNVSQDYHYIATITPHGQVIYDPDGSGPINVGDICSCETPADYCCCAGKGNYCINSWGYTP